MPDYYEAMRDYRHALKQCGTNIGHKILSELDKRKKHESHVFAFDIDSIAFCEHFAKNYNYYSYSSLFKKSKHLSDMETTVEDYVAWTTFDCTHVKVKMDLAKPVVRYIIERETKL